MELTLLNLKDAARLCRMQEEQKTASVKEAVAPELFSLLAGDGEDATFRRITSPSTMRDLNPVMHLRMQQVCFYLFMTTPFAKRIVRVIVDYMLGEGFKAIAEDPALQEVIDDFWQDPANNLDEALDNYAVELLVFGELCLPVAVNPVDGSVRLSYVDPQEIEIVEFALMKTAVSQEVSLATAVRLRKRIGENEGRRLEIIHVDEDVNSATFGQLKGDCFYFAINKVKAASRGISELFPLADWLDVFDNLVFDFADRVRLLNSLVWHYTVKGADDAGVQKIRDKVTKSPPRQGGVEVTNDQISIEARTPDLKGADMSMTERVVKNYGLGGAGLPPWFFADAGNTNRATADEMAGPTGKMLTSRQNIFKRLVTQILDYAIEQARAHGVLAPGADTSWKLQVPDLRVKDMAAAATALQTVANATGAAEDRGWIRAETAARAFHTVLTQIGVEIDTDEFDKAQTEKTSRDAKQQNDLNPQANLADALKGADGLKKAIPVKQTPKTQFSRVQ
jgi:hypothetical protein